jgi:uncharacterized protein YuzE
VAEAVNYIELAEAVSRVIVGSGLVAIKVSYDAEGDVLYVHFAEEPAVADDSEFVADDMVVRYRNGEVVGVTILNASTRKLAN